MRKIISFLILTALIVNPFFLNTALADMMKYGQLNIISEISGAKIYIDGKLEGENIVNLKITAGSHYLRVIDSQSNIIREEILNIKEGETSTIVIKQKKIEVEVLSKEESAKEGQIVEKRSDYYQLGFTSGKSDGYQEGMNKGVHEARINKAWSGWWIWIVVYLVLLSRK